MRLFSNERDLLGGEGEKSFQNLFQDRRKNGKIKPSGKVLDLKFSDRT